MVVVRALVLSGGSIPACAGSSCEDQRSDHTAGVHPRVRGEQTAEPWKSNWTRGPSPRARGADGGPLARRHGLGSIPACAGSSRRGRTALVVHRVHPRVRGEQ
ncbi:Putative membrane protein, clustering with ActP [Nocardiopsis sp. JB363]|nr:Putative membrane protein, clustering with ActP [Nocardiopsis sp. JB363]